MSSSHRRSGHTLLRDVSALGVAAPEVVARRLLAMSLAGNAPSRRDQAEMYRMSAEKVAAFYESWNAMFLEMFLANARFAVTSMGWPWRGARSGSLMHRMSTHAARTTAAVLAAGVAPVRRRAVANVKRLRRRSR